jgi:hypothetical protein
MLFGVRERNYLNLGVEIKYFRVFCAWYHLRFRGVKRQLCSKLVCRLFIYFCLYLCHQRFICACACVQYFVEMMEFVLDVHFCNYSHSLNEKFFAF